MTMITASTALTIFIMNIHHCGPEAQPVPSWARRFILNYLARICFVYDMGQSCVSLHSDKPVKQRNNCTVNGQARAEDFALRLHEGHSQKVKDQLNEDVSPTLSPQQRKEHQSGWRNGTFVEIEHGESAGATGETGASRKESVKNKEILVESQCLCHQQTLLRNVEYIANFYQEQKATQRRNAEWRKVAKVMDRFFMWIFFIMVFLMSLLIIGKAV